MGTNLSDYHFVFGSDLGPSFGAGYDYLNRSSHLAWGWRSTFISSFVTPGLPPVEEDNFICGGHVVLRMLCMCFAGYRGQPPLCPDAFTSYGMTLEEISRLPKSDAIVRMNGY